jgi:hypothetical protein
MTPTVRAAEPCVPSSAEGGAPAAAAKPAAVGELLDGGELILLAFRPSLWFVPIVSWPVIATAALVLLGAAVLESYWMIGSAKHYLAGLCSAAVILRLVIACFQWMGRMYVLTNRRVMRVRGLVHVDVFQCSLLRIRGTILTATPGERVLGLGSLSFQTTDDKPCEGTWHNIARPQEVQRTVEEAIRRA